MDAEVATPQSLVAEISDLRERIQMAEEALRAIRANEVDALVVGTDGSERVRTLSGADLCYRTFVETMGQGAATVSAEGTILYCNRFFSELLKSSPLITAGALIFNFVQPEDEGLLRTMLWEALTSSGSNARFSLRTSDGKQVPVVLTATPLMMDGLVSVCIILTDLSEHE